MPHGTNKTSTGKNTGNSLILAGDKTDHADLNPEHRALPGQGKYLKVHQHLPRTQRKPHALAVCWLLGSSSCSWTREHAGPRCLWPPVSKAGPSPVPWSCVHTSLRSESLLETGLAHGETQPGAGDAALAGPQLPQPRAGPVPPLLRDLGSSHSWGTAEQRQLCPSASRHSPGPPQQQHSRKAGTRPGCRLAW